MMDPHDEDLSTETYENIQKYAFKSDTDSIGSKINDYTMSDQVLEDFTGETSCKHNNHTKPTRLYNYETGVGAQPIYRTYKYEYFGKTTETYPIFFEWILKRTADNENFKDHNKVTEQDILLLANKNDENRNSVDLKSSTASSVSSIPNIKPPTESIIKKECPTPCVRELLCPKLPPCPLESSGGGSSGLDGSRGLGGFVGASGFSGQGSNPLTDPDNVQLQCSTRNINFKLKCSRLPPNCDFPEGTYECEIVNEGKYVDSKDLEACDLKCREIHAVHSDHDITIKQTEDSQTPIIIKKLDNTQEENKPPKKVINMMCSKNNVNFSLEHPSTTSNIIYPSDILFTCNIREQKTSSGEIFSTPLKCKQIHNLINDAESDSEGYKDNTQLLRNEQHSNTPVDQKDECPEKLESSHCVEEIEPAFPISHDVDDINEKRLHSKLKINIVKKDKSNSNLNESVDFICPNKNEDSSSTVFERLQSSFIENHNKTVQILKVATNDLLCRITNKNPCCRSSCANNKLECLKTATESCHKLLDSVCITTKALTKFTRETIDSYIGSQEESNQKSEDPPNCKLRKTSGEPSPEDFIKVINCKEIINDIANKNIFYDETPPLNQLETIKNSATKIFNHIKKITEDEFDTVKTVNSIKETCINLIDKASTILSGNTSDSPDENEPHTAQGFVKEVRTGIIIFQDENKTETRSEENMLSQDWTNSSHSLLSSPSTTFKELEPADSSVDNSAWKKIYVSKNNEPFTLYSMFATLRDKICSIFHDSQSESTYSTSSSVLSEQADDDHMN